VRVEVVRGAHAALYGPNAVTGVINIITEKPGENSKELQGNLTMGTHENYIGDVAYRKNINKKLSVGLTANLEYRRRNTNELYVFPNHGLFKSKLGPEEMAYIGMNGGLDEQLMGAFVYGAYRDENGVLRRWWPYSSNNNTKKDFRRISNRKFRRKKNEILNGGLHKKQFDLWWTLF
jgi:outer membrane receptor protein involved in Fe transport